MSSNEQATAAPRSRSGSNVNNSQSLSPPVPPSRSTHHSKHKKIFNKLQALVTSPKRAYDHTERDGLGGLLRGRRQARRESLNESHAPSKSYFEQLASDAQVSSPAPASVTLSQASTGSLCSSSAGRSPQAGGTSSDPSSSCPSSTDQHRRGSLSSIPVSANEKLSSSQSKYLQPPQVGPPSRGPVRPHDLPKIVTHDMGEPSLEANLEPNHQPQILLRPHLKLRIVTWNMHDSLPTGDLTELLGNPSSTCNAPGASDRPMPLDPEHPVQPLSSGVDAGSPYHLVVVGGQEVPVGYGGWSGPNWTETIQAWLSGTSSDQPLHTAPSTPNEPDPTQSPQPGKQSNSRSPPSPLTAHRRFLDQQDTEDAVIPEDALDLREKDSNSPTPHAGVVSKEMEEQEILGTGVAALQTGNNQPLNVGNLHYVSRSARSSMMDRTNSSSSTETDNSMITDRSTLPDINVVSAAEEATVGMNVLGEAEPDPETTDITSPYVLVTKERLMGIYCSLWAHRSCIHLVQGTSTGTVTAGLLAGKLGNKGAACISLMIANTRLLFVCAHLAAHSGKSALRQANVRKIKEELIIDTFQETPAVQDKPKLRRALSVSRPTAGRDLARSKRSGHNEDTLSPSQSKDITDLFDYTFWFGDLNFRLDISRLHADFLIKEKNFKDALTFDQLQPILKNPEGCFQGFTEAPIAFAPSYKYDVMKMKRSRTIQRTNTVTAGLGSSTGTNDWRTSRSATSQQNSSVDASASRTTIVTDVVTEEDEGDSQSIDGRASIASSRASISSAYRDARFHDDSGSFLDKETLANTSHNHRNSAGMFGTSIPSTPTAEKVLDKAKGLLNLIRARSPTTASSSSEAARRTSKDEPARAPDQVIRASPRATAEERVLSPTTQELSQPVGVPELQGTSPHEDDLAFENSSRVSYDGSSRRNSTDFRSQRAHTPNPIRSTTPISSPRPRLRSMRSNNTMLSLSSLGAGKSMTSTNHEHDQQDVTAEAAFDTSSKQRVQSWTDRILYKSTVPVEDHLTNLENGSPHNTSLGGSLLSSIRGFKKSLRDARDHDEQQLPAREAFEARAKPVMYERSSRQADTFRPAITTEALYKVQSSSAASLFGSQQRLDGRFAKLFKRSSSGSHREHRGVLSESSGHGLHSSAELPLRPPLDLSTVSSGPVALHSPSFTMSRSASCRHPFETTLLRDRTFALQPAHMMSHTDVSPVRQKPGRALTSPLPSSIHNKSSNMSVPTISLSTDHASGALVNGSRPISLSVAPLKFGSKCQPAFASAQTLPALAFGVLDEVKQTVSQRADDASLDTHYPQAVSLQLRPSTSQGESLATIDNTTQAKASFDQHDEAVDAPPEKDAHSSRHISLPSRKTGITLKQSKTTPVSAAPPEHSEKSHGLRQWWNVRMLPHIFSFHPSDAASARNGDTDTDIHEENEPGLPEFNPPKPPEPVIRGPRRGEIHCIAYDTIADLRRMEACSDHRPVVAVFAIGM